MEYLKQFQKKILEGNFPQVVSLWQEYSLCEEIHPMELEKILLLIKTSPFSDSFGKYVEEVLPLWESFEEGEEKERILSLILTIQTTNSDQLFSLAQSVVDRKYSQDPNFSKLLRYAPLKRGENFQGILSKWELLVHLKPGRFCLHTKGMGVGEVVSLSFLREEVSFEFESVSGVKELSFKNALSVLLPISADHFLAKRFGDPDSFQELSEKDPAQAIRILLRDLGPKSALEIKNEMCDYIIPEEKWQKWWQQARSKLKKDPLIEVPTSLQEPFYLRSSELTHEERLLQELSHAPSTSLLIELVYCFLRDFPSIAKSSEFKETLKGYLVKPFETNSIDLGQEISIFFLLNDLLDGAYQTQIEELIPSANDPKTTMDEIPVLSFKKRFLVELVRKREDWESFYLQLLLVVEQTALKDYLLSELLRQGKGAEVEAEMKKVVQEPGRYPFTLIWYMSSVLSTRDLPLSDAEGMRLLFEALITLLHELENQPNQKEMIKKILSIVTSNRYEHIRLLFSKLNLQEMKEMLLLCSKCRSFSDHDQKILRSLAEVVFPSLSSNEEEKEKEDSFIWCMEEGYHKVKKRIEEIVEVDILDTAKEIEVARSYGDLRENSEFKFALEKRDLLQAEYRKLTSDLSKMRILNPEDVNATKIGVGVVFGIQFEDGSVVSYTVLGPFDADAEKSILSYQSKFIKELEGKQVGDSCQVNKKQGKINFIKSIFS